MFSASERPHRLSLGIALVAYAAGAGLAGLATAHAVQRVGGVVLTQLAPPSPPRIELRLARLALAAAEPPARPDAAMTPLADRSAERRSMSEGRPRLIERRLAAGPQFGSSSRGTSRWQGFFERPGGEDEEVRRGATYRTVCVRLCDGYYFPVSFAITEDRLGRDREVCESRCGAQGRLFVHRNPGGSIEDMEDLQGRAYRQLRTAFLYRTEYVPSCKCQPHPWEVEARDRHRTYALAVAVRKGSKDAAKELAALQAKAKQAAKASDKNRAGPIVPPAPVEVTNRNGAPAPASKEAEIAARESGTLMRLGGDGAPKKPANIEPARQLPQGPRDPDWAKRAFGAAHGG
jgi:hypothetical protein